MAKSVLNIDDSATIRKMVSMALVAAGFDVTEAVDGQDGLTKAQAKTFDIVLTDQNMPHMDGLTLVKSLRALSQYKSTPIIMLTTESDDARKAEGRAAGVNAWLVKPFDPQLLVSALKKVAG
ncbi:MAG TPA: response regulator [Methylophilaceae bacterium]|jgi:two-component system chemotaxis response regulator CheY